MSLFLKLLFNSCMFVIATCLCESVAWTFVATKEAVVNINGEVSRCLGNCIWEQGTLQCIYSWSRHTARCHSTGQPVLRYRTDKNEECISNCDNFQEKSYQWCATSNTNWDKCSRHIALSANRTMETENRFTTCIDSCAKRDYNYYWCHAANGKWEYCNPLHKTHSIDYSTEDGSVCASRCKFYGSERKPYCYTTQREWKRCFLNPSYDQELYEIDQSLRTGCDFGIYTERGYEQCSKGKFNRIVRAVNKKIKEDNIFDCNMDVAIIAERHRAFNPTVTIRQEDPNYMINHDANPVLNYTILPITSYFSEGSPVEDLPLVIEALITTYTLSAVEAPRLKFGIKTKGEYNATDKKQRNEIFDERNRNKIVMDQLNDAETFNIFPNTWDLSRETDSPWYYMEEDITQFLRGFRDRYVRFTAVFSYTIDDNGDDDNTLVHRPAGVLVRVRAFSNGVQVDLNDRVLKGTSRTENMYFFNDANQSC